jgi:hypothetical protein
MRRLNSDVVIALLLMVLSIVLFTETFTLERVRIAIIGAKLWPRIVVVLLFLLSAIYLIQSLRAPSEAARPPFRVRDWLAANRNIVTVFALYALFVLTLPYLGMLIGGIAFVLATLTAIGDRGMRAHAVHAAIAIVAVGSMWSIFTFALRVILPGGEILPL